MALELHGPSLLLLCLGAYAPRAALPSSKVELLVNLHNRNTCDNRELTLMKSKALASYAQVKAIASFT